MTFKQEYSKFLKAYHVDKNERNVWEGSARFGAARGPLAFSTGRYPVLVISPRLGLVRFGGNEADNCFKFLWFFDRQSWCFKK